MRVLFKEIMKQQLICDLTLYFISLDYIEFYCLLLSHFQKSDQIPINRLTNVMLQINGNELQYYKQKQQVFIIFMSIRRGNKSLQKLIAQQVILQNKPLKPPRIDTQNNLLKMTLIPNFQDIKNKLVTLKKSNRTVKLIQILSSKVQKQENKPYFNKVQNKSKPTVVNKKQKLSQIKLIAIEQEKREDQIDQQENNKKEIQEALDKKQKQIELIKNQNVQLNQIIAKKDSHLLVLNSTIRQLNDELRIQKQKGAKTIFDQSGLSNSKLNEIKINTQQKSIIELQKRNNEFRIQNQKLYKQIKQKQKQLIKKENIIQQFNQQIAKQRISNKNRIQILLAQFETKDNENQKLKNQIKEYNYNKLELNNQSLHMAKKIGQLNLQKQELQKENELIKKSIRQKQSINQKLTEEINSFLSKMSVLEKEKNNFELLSQSQVQKIEYQRKRLDELEQAFKQYNKNMIKVGQIAKQSKREMNNALNLKNKYQQQNILLIKKINELKSQNIALNRSYNDLQLNANNQIKQLRAQVEYLFQKRQFDFSAINNNNSKLKQYQNDSTRYQNQIKMLQQKYNKLFQSSQKNKKIVLQMQKFQIDKNQQKELLLAQKNKAEKLINEKDQIIKRLKKQILELNKKYSSLQILTNKANSNQEQLIRLKNIKDSNKDILQQKCKEKEQRIQLLEEQIIYFKNTIQIYRCQLEQRKRICDNLSTQKYQLQKRFNKARQRKNINKTIEKRQGEYGVKIFSPPPQKVELKQTQTLIDQINDLD